MVLLSIDAPHGLWSTPSPATCTAAAHIVVHGLSAMKRQWDTAALL